MAAPPVTVDPLPPLMPQSAPLAASGSDAASSMSSSMLRVLDMAFTASSPRPVQGYLPPMEGGPTLLYKRNGSRDLAVTGAPLDYPRRASRDAALRKPPNEEEIKQIEKSAQELRDVLIRDDGTFRGGSIQKVLVHVVFMLADPELIDCFLHCYRYHCTAPVLLKEISTAFQERLDINLVPPSKLSADLAQFLTSWIDLYFEKDFIESPLRSRLLKLIERITDVQERNKLKLLVIRQAASLKHLKGLTNPRRFSATAPTAPVPQLTASQPNFLPTSPSDPGERVARLRSVPTLTVVKSSPPGSLTRESPTKPPALPLSSSTKTISPKDLPVVESKSPPGSMLRRDKKERPSRDKDNKEKSPSARDSVVKTPPGSLKKEDKKDSLSTPSLLTTSGKSPSRELAKSDKSPARSQPVKVETGGAKVVEKSASASLTKKEREKQEKKAEKELAKMAKLPTSTPISARPPPAVIPTSASMPLRRTSPRPASALTSSGVVTPATWTVVALRDESHAPAPLAQPLRPGSARRRGFSWMGSAAAMEAEMDDEELSNNGRRSILLNYKADDIAKQLTIIEFTMYENVSASEFQDNAFSSKNKHTQAPFCTAMVNFSNKITAWIEHEILSRHGSRQVTAMERAIRLAEKCKELRNYNALMEVFSALSQVTISRLKDTWARIDPKLRTYFADLEELLTPIGNFRKFREEIKASLDLEVPVLPYVGTFLRDVLFANDGNPTTVLHGSMKLVNFDKIQVVGNQISYFNRFKKHKFAFPVQVQLRDLLVALPSNYEAPMTRERALSTEVKI